MTPSPGKAERDSSINVSLGESVHTADAEVGSSIRLMRANVPGAPSVVNEDALGDLREEEGAPDGKMSATAGIPESSPTRAEQLSKWP